MRKGYCLVTIGVLILVLIGCSQRPEREICAHLSALIQAQDAVNTGALHPRACELDVERLRDVDSEAFARVESCLLAARSLDAASFCGF